MSLFRCFGCGCVENTALCRYWAQKPKNQARCSECNPDIGRWHGRFPQRDADLLGYVAIPNSNFIEMNHD